MNRLYEMDTRGAVSTITINVFFFIIFGYIKLNALLLSDDFFLCFLILSLKRVVC